MVKEINDMSFDQVISVEDKLVLVDFWAPWCGNCEMIAPRVDEISEELSDKIDFYKINVDDNKKNLSKYRIMGIPALMIFKKGELVDRIVGDKPKEEIIEILEKHI
ncbi:thioredoxin [Clostridium sp.]|jgi:thioredoxin 1|uniref:thioredoxin n=1 Tax=Clostridium sp. TaxID=1506 RepID=UPI002FC918D0